MRRRRIRSIRRIIVDNNGNNSNEGRLFPAVCLRYPMSDSRRTFDSVAAKCIRMPLNSCPLAQTQNSELVTLLMTAAA